VEKGLGEKCDLFKSQNNNNPDNYKMGMLCATKISGTS
jgi:hypothetical protein